MEIVLDQIAFEAAVVAEAGGWASQADVALLEANKLAWAAALRRLIFETDEGLARCADLDGELRALALEDLGQERSRLSDALLRASGERIDPPGGAAARAEGTAHRQHQIAYPRLRRVGHCDGRQIRGVNF